MALRILGCLAKANDLIVINVIPFIPFFSDKRVVTLLLQWPVICDSDWPM